MWVRDFEYMTGFLEFEIWRVQVLEGLKLEKRRWRREKGR